MTAISGSSSSDDGGGRVFTDLHHRDGAGWIGGLSTVQAVLLLASGIPVVVSVAAHQWRAALGFLAVAAVAAAVVVVPVRGRPAARWAADLARYTTGGLMGWTAWRTRALTTTRDGTGSTGVRESGTTGDQESGSAGVPDLPGVLARFRFHDGPPLSGRRICLIQDTVDGRWAATAAVVHTGVAMASETECSALADRLGAMLVGLAGREVIDRVSVCVRTVPDDGTAHQLWRAAHEHHGAPDLARRVADEIDQAVAAVTVRTEVFVTVSGTETALRRPAKAAGGGVEGRAYALYRVLEAVADGLRTLGASQVSWLSSGQVAAAVRTGFNPAAAARIHRHHHTSLTSGGAEAGAGAEGGVSWASAGPVIAPPPAARSYTHDGFRSVAYAVIPPVGGTTFGTLGPLLAVRTAGERRALTIHYEVLPPEVAARQVARSRFRATAVADIKAARGFGASAAEQRRRAGGHDHEQAVAAGHALVRYTLTAAVTVPAEWVIEDHAAGLENDAAARFDLLRLELLQDAGFAAAALPLGYGLPGRADRRWRQ